MTITATSNTNKHWLIKSNPKCFSIGDLQQKGSDMWEGVRNYRARNFMRDDMQVGDQVLFYHSSAKPSGVAGVVTVTRAGYPDPTQFHPESRHYDPRALQDKPRWYVVDVAFSYAFADILPLSTLKDIPALEDCLLLRKGCEQLTVLPLEARHWQAIMTAAADADLI
ncbi:EVE domain-containing protein [Psychrobacter pygoscelis]|uniref:EVE domain-containing protein n=1 Tax=Psychrobacter pygoscelis TaxID=2488563 RepID=UPI00103A6267|nr:EVE domain-containing protein [Psychrobacter pygoscelis]